MLMKFCTTELTIRGYYVSLKCVFTFTLVPRVVIGRAINIMRGARVLEVAVACGLSRFLELVFGAVYRENLISHMFRIATRKNSRDIRFSVIG